MFCSRHHPAGPPRAARVALHLRGAAGVRGGDDDDKAGMKYILIKYINNDIISRDTRTSRDTRRTGSSITGKWRCCNTGS